MNLHNSSSQETPPVADYTVLCYNMLFAVHCIISQVENEGIGDLFIELGKFDNTKQQVTKS